MLYAKKISFFIAFWICFAICDSEVLIADDRSAKIKAAVAFQLPRFIDQANSNPANTEFNFCIAGESNFSMHLKAFAQDKVLSGRLVVIKQLQMAQVCELLPNQCDVIFVDLVVNNITTCMERIKKNQTKLICNVHKPVWNQCVIEIYEESNRARIAINLELAKVLKMRVSSELLDLAVVHLEKTAQD